jgi:hypothetical protein
LRSDDSGVGYEAVNKIGDFDMKGLSLAVIACLIFLPLTSRSTEIAHARIWCLSLRFQEGSDSTGVDTLDFSTINNSYNGELAPYSQRTWGSGFVLDSLSLGMPITGTIYIDLPPLVDANGNGFDDFFEVSQGVGASTTGRYTTAISTGTVTASWSRAAGSKDGSCLLDLMDSSVGDLGTFRNNFELIEYTGPLAYTPGATNVNGSVNLVQTANTNNLFQGPVQFVKSATNRFNLLTLQVGGWTNANQQTMTFQTEPFQRDPTWPTNYYGYFQFDDGDPTTPEIDYVGWVLSIDDTNDMNHNGIPDFSDDPATNSLPRRPLLSLALGTTNLALTVHGDVGHLHIVQQLSSFALTNWQTVASVTLTNDPQVVRVALPGGARGFWRVVAQ